jgi:DNA-directed RNA polymerase specialized sigma24 family protein
VTFKMSRAETADDVDDLYRQQAVSMVRLALVLTGDRATAEDVVQDAFLGLCRRRPGLTDPASRRQAA